MPRDPARRAFLKRAGGNALGLMGASLSLQSCGISLAQGIGNACLQSGDAWNDNALVKAAWAGVDASQVWDCHCHLLGIGDNNSGIEVNPAMRSFWHPIQYAQFSFYLDASCAEQAGTSIDQGVVNRLRLLARDFPLGAKFMLMAFEHHYDESGAMRPEYSAFYVPNQYAANIARHYPQRFEWIASVHPYRRDALERLQWCIDNGAKAVKWLPGAMGINPDSERCDEFYAVLARNSIPLLSHAGSEHAVETPSGQTYNNPLLLRRPLKQGVRVIAAHCASLGQFKDLDAGNNASTTSGYALFKRLLAETGGDGSLIGDISAVTLINREREVIRDIISNSDLHKHLINGSDYPLPGIVPLINTAAFVDDGWLSQEQATLLNQVRESNALLFDFLLKRMLKVDGQSLPATVMQSKRVFDEVVVS